MEICLLALLALFVHYSCVFFSRLFPGLYFFAFFLAFFLLFFLSGPPLHTHSLVGFFALHAFSVFSQVMEPHFSHQKWGSSERGFLCTQAQTKVSGVKSPQTGYEKVSVYNGQKSKIYTAQHTKKTTKQIPECK